MVVQISDLDRQRMDQVTSGVEGNKSEQMRRLAAAGYSRADIARYLGVRYQFVRNVLVAAEQAAEAVESTTSGGTECDSSMEAAEDPDFGSAGSVETTSKWVWTVVRRDGSVVLPAAYLKAIGAAEGDQVQLALEGDLVRVLGRARALGELQDQVQRYVPEGVSLVEELLAERRAEAAREDEA